MNDFPFLKVQVIGGAAGKDWQDNSVQRQEKGNFILNDVKKSGDVSRSGDFIEDIEGIRQTDVPVTSGIGIPVDEGGLIGYDFECKDEIFEGDLIVLVQITEDDGSIEKWTIIYQRANHPICLLARESLHTEIIGIIHVIVDRVGRVAGG